jgi:transcriptional regulator with XRE-family HTH domain
MSADITNPNILEELGARLSRHRLNKNLTQEELAHRAGISVATLKRIEHGGSSTLLINMINVLRALGLDQNLELIVPEVPPSPIQLAHLQKRVRQRAGRKRKAPSDVDSPTWTWSDDKHS